MVFGASGQGCGGWVLRVNHPVRHTNLVRCPKFQAPSGKRVQRRAGLLSRYFEIFGRGFSAVFDHLVFN